jgi:hypothetical protein
MLNLSVQPLMLSKVKIEGIGLTNFNLDPCLYWILTTMGGLEKAQRLTK